VQKDEAVLHNDSVERAEIVDSSSLTMPSSSLDAAPGICARRWSEHVNERYLKYYADERCRQQWLVDYPDYVMPAHEDPPFDRDSLLPQAHET
jgi:hypothetical protein